MAKSALFSRVFFAKLLLDVSIAGFAAWIAFVLRLDFSVLRYYRQGMALYISGAVLAKMSVHFFFGLQRQSWSSIGIRDLLSLVRAVGGFTLVLFPAVLFLSGAYRIPRSIPLIDALLTFLLWGGVRLTARLFLEDYIRPVGRKSAGEKKRVLIIGAGDAGTMIAREMLRHPEARMNPVAFLDDDWGKIGLTYVGSPVFGPVGTLSDAILKFEIDEILIAIPSAQGDVIRAIVERAAKLNVPARIIPGIWEVLSGRVSISSIRDVEVEDLLSREPVRLELDEIAGYVRGRTVLVTGAGGSIGSEIVRQLIPFAPARLVLLGRGENSLFQIEQELCADHPCLPFTTVVADVRNRERLARVFERFRPQVVFHAAAHKHVPLMEENPEEAVLNNVFGTANLAELALEHAVEVFVNISTDKAVNPTSIMGASKRVAEMIVRSTSARAGEGRAFVSVRFGNVLGSRGSVIPTFKEQIRRGGPVTVTHPGMTRYFMTIPEAAQLVLQAGGMKHNGAVFVLDMGEPVKITNLAEDLIRLSGFEPGKDIEIIYTGIRPGEKLFEELLTAEEGTDASRFKKIFFARNNDLPERFDELLGELYSAAESEREGDIRTLLKRIIPHALFEAGEPSVCPCRIPAGERGEAV